jgi:acyl-CoA synthetase (AMP-forming)/AMP-acid ligase II
VTRLTLSDGVRAAAARHPGRVAITIDDLPVTYAQLIDRIDRVSAGALQDFRLRPGERVALCLPNCLPWMELMSGFSAAGVACAMVPPMATPAEVRVIVDDCEPRVMVCHASNEEQVRAGASHAVERFLVVDGKGADAYEAWLQRARPFVPPPVDETAIFCIAYSSGATGKPKGILLSHRSRILTAYAAAAEYRALGPSTRMLVSTPVFHGAGFLNLLAPCWFGGQAVVLSRFSVERMLSLIQEHRITKAHLVPAHFAAYFALSSAERAKYDVSSVRCIVSGTAPLAQSMKERIVEAFGADVLHERYGSTEASIVSNLRPADQLRKSACVGLPFPMVEIDIRGADGRPLGPGETGELWSRSPLMFSGYWRRPEAEARAIRDGWVSAGDLARRDDEGYLYLVDRKDDMIISGGENVYPREIEERLLEHPAVAEASVIGVPHEYWGEAITAFVHLREGQSVEEEALRAFCGERLAKWKTPKRIHFCGPLPRNNMGKILRRLVRERSQQLKETAT